MDSTTQTVYYLDDDGDGYGNVNIKELQCTPSGHTSQITPTAMTEDATLSPETLWYADTDGDGYGSISASLTQCTQPASYVLNYSDCDDGDSSEFPGQTWCR